MTSLSEITLPNVQIKSKYLDIEEQMMAHTPFKRFVQQNTNLKFVSGTFCIEF